MAFYHDNNPEMHRPAWDAEMHRPAWDMSALNRKKELPPLQNTVEVYRNVKKANKRKKKTNVLKNGLSNNVEDRESSLDIEENSRNGFNKNNYTKDAHMNPGYTKEYESDENDIDEPQHSKMRTADSVNYSARTEETIISNSHLSDLNQSNMDYRKMALDLASGKKTNDQSNRRRKRALPDFVLVYDCTDNDTLHISEREQFENNISNEGIEIGYNIIKNHTFVELYASFDRLCQEAEHVALEMPLEGVSIYYIFIFLSKIKNLNLLHIYYYSF